MPKVELVETPTSGLSVVSRKALQPSPNKIAYGMLISLLLLWESAVSLGVIDGRFLSKPTAIVFALIRLGADTEVRVALLVTARAIAISSVLGCTLGVFIGLILGQSRLLRDAFLPFVIQLLGLPKSVFLPLFIVFFGLGQGPGIAFGTLLALIQVIISVIGAIDSIDKSHYRTARAHRASRWQVFTAIVIPGAAPGIFAAIWHGIRNAFIGVIVAQMFISNIGVGFLVRRYTSFFAIDDALALVFATAVIVIVVGNGWSAVERKISHWRVAGT